MFNLLNAKYLLLVAFCVVCGAQGQLVGEACVRDYDNSPGICKAARDCRNAREDYKTGIPMTECAILKKVYIICCVDKVMNIQTTNRTSTTSKRISQEKCEGYAKLTYTTAAVNSLTFDDDPILLKTSKCNSTTPLIVGGSKTKNGELPHMAAIGWEKPEGIAFRCGGTLISNRFVLTAAHCFPYGDLPSIVRLGDQNLYSNDDGLKGLNVPIKDHFIHEKYDHIRKINDIGLIELASLVQFSVFIRPACLWPKFEIDNKKCLAAGWGKTTSNVNVQYGSNDLRKVELDIVTNGECQNLMEKYSNISPSLSDTQMCADVPEGGKDTCAGDSGGPLVITKRNNDCLFYVIGITSYGANECGKKGYPGVYTRVSSFLDWIEGKVWE